MIYVEAPGWGWDGFCQHIIKGLFGLPRILRQLDKSYNNSTRELLGFILKESCLLNLEVADNSQINRHDIVK